MAFHRRLVHPSIEGAGYFVTWRLEGSLPVARVADLWTLDGPKFVECDRLLDAGATGPRWLERSDVAGVVVETLRGPGHELGSWVLMPNHVHAVVRPALDRDLGAVVQNLKGRSARAANLLLGSNKSFWAKDYFDRRIRDSEHEGRVARYIENNPVRAGLCERAEEWRWSSAWRERD